VLLEAVRACGRINAETMLTGIDPKTGRPATLRSLGRRLRAIRIQKSLTQQSISERSGLPSSQISRIENGYRLPSLETLERITAALQVPVCDLFYEVGVAHRASTLPFQKAVTRIIADAKKKGTGEEGFLVALKAVLPRLTEVDCELILSIARKMAATKPSHKDSRSASQRSRR
jgi:transcriptional regulator with XRE-family HTH domain